MPKKKPPSEWLAHLEHLASGETPAPKLPHAAARVFMVDEATLSPGLRETLAALLLRAGADPARLAHSPELPEPLAAVAELLAEVKAMRGLEAPPRYREQGRRLEALARACEDVSEGLAELTREPHGLDFVFRHFYVAPLGPPGSPEARSWPDARFIADSLVSDLKRGSLFIAPAARRRARELAAIEMPRHRPKAALPRYAMRELARVWERETGRLPGYSGDPVKEGGPFARFARAALGSIALECDVTEILREMVVKRRGTKPRNRAAKKKATRETSTKPAKKRTRTPAKGKPRGGRK